MCLLELCPKHERAGLKRGLQGHPTSVGFSARTLTGPLRERFIHSQLSSRSLRSKIPNFWTMMSDSSICSPTPSGQYPNPVSGWAHLPGAFAAKGGPTPKAPPLASSGPLRPALAVAAAAGPLTGRLTAPLRPRASSALRRQSLQRFFLAILHAYACKTSSPRN